MNLTVPSLGSRGTDPERDPDWDADSAETGQGSGTGPRRSMETKRQGGHVRGAGDARPE